MESNLINFLLNFIKELAKFGGWLLEPLPYLNISPIMLFSFSGLTLLIGFLLVRLVVGG